MHRLALVLVVMSACKQHDEPQPSRAPAVEDPLDEAAGYTEDMCRRQTIPCADAADAGFVFYASKARSLSGSAVQRVSELTSREQTCRAHAWEVGAPRYIPVLLNELEGFRLSICACNAPKCANEVETNLAEFTRHTDEQMKTYTPSAQEREQVAAVRAKIDECMTKAKHAADIPRPE